MKSKVDFSSMSKTDIEESVEMLRAAHTLLRTAFGICALFLSPSSEDEAKKVTDPFNSCFLTIANVANGLLGQLKSFSADSGESVNS